ncbi:MAG: hypothetical protein JF592_18415 [Microbacterium sp.]|uniref:hypothetical protein n=1 Tax=Microbacterium sp. TaxID=51671 RepID=UPI001D33C047|nr:hypothetical protein [Microbacterium sp.]MBW8764523.1 hypothetical protein [Microbacterium sp.]
MGSAKAAKAARREARELAARTQFWHGGIGGLQPGEHILAPVDTGSPLSVAGHVAEARADRVYLATDRELARVFASIITDATGRSAVYQVQPIGPIGVDLDFPACSHQARRALIVAVEEVDVQLSETERLQRTAPYLSWDDGRPMYDADGRIQVTWQMESVGVTQEFLNRLLQPWSTTHQAEAVVRRFFALPT